MTRLLPFIALPLCRLCAARQVAGVVAVQGVVFEGAPPGVPVR